MKEISLTQGKSALVDDRDAYLLAWKWYFDNTVGYAKRNFRNQDGKQRKMRMHHMIIGFPLNGFQVDHINGNRLDNRRCNLRIVSHRENSHNSKCHRNGTKSSRFIGVSLDRNKWVAQISINGKRKNLGRYSTEEEAVDVYNNYLREFSLQS